MARRLGGDQPPPPTAAPDWHARRPSRVGVRSNLLFLAPVPFAFQALGAGSGGLALNLAAALLLFAAAWLTREGLRAEEAWEERPVARPPALPRKALGAAAMGLGVAFAAFSGGAVFEGPLLGAMAAGLHLAAFGLDPMRDRSGDAASVAALQADRVARAVDGAERTLAEMTAAIARLGDRDLADRLARVRNGASDMARALEQDPRGLTSARRYLGVYLLGARDATVQFADLQARSPDPGLRARYVALLDDLDRSYAARTRALQSGDRAALDIEMDVLQDRLAREGLRPEQS